MSSKGDADKVKRVQTESKKAGQAVMYRDENREKAFKKRYGKNVHVFMTFTMNPDSTYKEVTLQFETPAGRHYSLQEFFKDNGTDYVVLSYIRDKRNLQYRYTRFLDAEVNLADLLAEELEHGNAQ